jgi:hypothetical protein
MKKVLLLFAFVFLAKAADAQITVAGATIDSNINGTWALQGNNSITFNDDTSTDEGTERYVKNGSNGNYRIYRRNNFWYIRFYYSEFTTQTLIDQEIFRHEYLSTSNFPPCIGVWTMLGNTGAFNSINANNLTITSGNCSSQTYSQSVSFNTNNVQYPQLNSANFNTIVPVKGMLTFNAELSSLFLYDGAKWQQLHGSLDDIHLTESDKVIFGNIYQVSGTESKLNKLEVKEIKVSDALTVVSKSNFYKAMHLPVTIHSGNNDLTLTDAMQIVVLNSTGSTARTFTLPAPNTAKGRIYELQNYTTNANLLIGGYTVQTNGSGGTISTILPGAGIRIFSDGTTWRKLN